MVAKYPVTRRGLRDSLLDRRALRDLFLVGLRVRAAALEEVVEGGDDPDAHGVVVKRDVPEPAVAARGLEHHGGALVPPGVAVRPLPVGPDGALVENRVPDAKPQAVLDDPRLAAGVHHDLGPHLPSLAVFALYLDPHRPTAFEQDVQNAHALVGGGPVLPGVLEHHLVELAAHHLPGLRALVGLVVPEVEGRRELAARVDELDAVLLHEVALLHLGQHAEPLQHPVGLRDQGFADVEARELLALEELHPQPLLGEKGGGRGPRGTASDHDDVRGGGLLSRIGHQLRSSRAGWGAFSDAEATRKRAAISEGMGMALIDSPGPLLTQAMVRAPVAMRLGAAGELAHVAHRPFLDRRDADADLELVLEAEGAVIVERGRNPRPADGGAGGRDAEPGRPPQGVLGLLHVAEECGEVDDAGRVGLVELRRGASSRCSESGTLGSAKPGDPLGRARAHGHA